MFTGIIQHVGQVVAVRGAARSRVLTIDVGPLADDIAPGDSVSVDGACLTATGREAERAEFDVSAETLRLTTIGELTTGDDVNLETALRVGDQLGGHFVSAHVDGTGIIRRKEKRVGEVRLEVEVPPRLTDLMIMKGSVAVDGISLTIAALSSGRFEISVIPFTLRETTLRDKGPGFRVNIECDMIGRWVRKLLATEEPPSAEGISMEDLRQGGF